MLSVDSAAHVTSLRPVTASASAAISPALGKRSRADAIDVAAAADEDVGIRSASVGALGLESDADGEAHLQTIEDRVAALPRGTDEPVMSADGPTAAQLEEDETITADSLSVLLSQVRTSPNAPWPQHEPSARFEHTRVRRLSFGKQ